MRRTLYPASVVTLRPLADPEAGPAPASVIPADCWAGLTPEREARLDAALARINRATEAATALILLLAALWFCTALPGASIPETGDLPFEIAASNAGASLP